MITIFATCKPFVGDDDWRQRNAIKSWLKITSSIILFGDDQGTKQAAREFDCLYVPDVKCNEHDRPYVNDMFKRAQDIGHGVHFCYVNADNMVKGLAEAFEHVGKKFPHFLFVGKRWDWIYPVEVEGINEDWWGRHRKGSLHNEWALEYFGFSKGLLRNLPEFLVGWPGWDNWVVLNTLRAEVPVVDVTKVVTCVHQKHERSWQNDRENPQHEWNLALAADLLVPKARGSVEAATWILEEDGEIHPR